MSEPPSNKPPSLAKLLAAVGMPDLSNNERRTQAYALSREVVARSFASAYLRTFSPELAYREVHPKVTSANRSRRWVCDRGAYWMARPRVAELIKQGMEQLIDRANIELRKLALQIDGDLNADIFDFMEFNNEGKFTGWKLNPEKMTKAQRQSVRAIKMTRYGMEVVMYDRQRAQEHAMALVALSRKLGENNEDGSLPAELIRHLEALSSHRADVLERLPPSRIRHIIEGESKAV